MPFQTTWVREYILAMIIMFYSWILVPHNFLVAKVFSDHSHKGNYFHKFYQEQSAIQVSPLAELVVNLPSLLEGVGSIPT